MRSRLAGAAMALAALALPLARADAAGPAMPPLHVAHRGGLPLIVDNAGRTVVLRGTNASGFEDDWYRDRNPDGTQKVAPFWPVDPHAYANGKCPTNSHVISQPALCEEDFAQMHALGFNVVRLTVSWSELEPQPGHVDPVFLDRVQQVVQWAAAQHIYVLLDMHQDDYSRFIPPKSPVEVPGLVTSTPGSGNHEGGAPPWAIVTDGIPSAALAGQDFLNTAIEAAFTSFWLNRAAPDGRGLQDHYIDAVSALARRVRGNPAVVGFEIINEPLPGLVQEPVFSQTLLYPFYRRFVRHVASVDKRHLFFFEPMALRNQLDVAAQVSLPFTRNPNVVYAPHVYTHVFTADASVPGASSVPYPLSYDQAFQTATLEARLMRSALFIGEYGNGARSDDRFLAPETAALDRHMASATVWHWKANCDPGTGAAGCPDSWGTYFGDPTNPPANRLGIKPSRLKYLARIYPRATVGRLESFGFDPNTGAFAMAATASTRSGGDTEVVIPAHLHGRPYVGGAATLRRVVVEPDGTRVVYVAPTGRGRYTIGVAP